MEELFSDRNYQVEIDEQAESGPDITREEVRSEINRLKNNKPSGLDEIHSKVLKLLEDEQIEIVTRLSNRIYETSKLPEDWYLYVFITLPKKPNAKKCEEHRVIRLMSHALKIFLNIILARIYSDEQMCGIR